MMKRMLSLLLSLCLMAGLFAGMTTTAYAAGDTQEYIVKSGDNLSTICSNLGVDYAKNKEWIINTNKLTDPNKLSVGQKLIMPAKGKVLKWEGSTDTTTTPASTVTTDTIAYTPGVSTIQYTLKSGDFISVVCKKLGIDFAANDAWIRAANNISSYNNLAVGRVIILPAPGTTPALSTAGSSSGVSAVTTVATTTSSGASLLSGDSVKYYLFDYTVRSGDTLFKICQAYGANMDTVQKLNNIANPAALRVGQVLSIPSSIAPSSGTYTRIVAHKVVSGDTVQKICNNYGINYGPNAAKIKALNNRDNLDVIQVGQTILIPVPGSGSSSGSVTPSGSSVVPSGSSSGTAYYTLNKTGSVNGTYSLTVNGQSINGASSGQTVHVVATPDHGYKLNKITVTKAYNGQEVKVDKNNNFVMPACNVNISVTFKTDPNSAPHSINKSSVGDTSSVTLTYVVNGYSNATAEKGQTVALVLGTLPSGRLLSKVYVTTVAPTSLTQLTKGTLDAKYFVSVSSNLTFTMPASDVYITIVLKNA